MRQNTLKELSKKIKKCIRDRKRTKRKEKIQRILEEVRGIKSISYVKSGRKRTFIPKVKNDKGETITSRKGIANVFGEFYSKLYAEKSAWRRSTRPSTPGNKNEHREESANEDVRNEIPEFTQDEVQAATDNFEKGKASDNNGIRAEDIKTCDETIRQIYKKRKGGRSW